MQENFKKQIIDGIVKGDYRFAEDKLGNNYLLVVPDGMSQIQKFKMVNSLSFIGGNNEATVKYMNEGKYDEDFK